MNVESIIPLLFGMQAVTLIVVINAAIKVGSLATKVDTMWMQFTRQHRTTDTNNE